MTSPVVVGIDDLHQSPHALELAAREAELRVAPLWMAHAYRRVPPAAVGVPGGRMLEQTVLDAAIEPLAGALKQVRADHPGMSIRTYALAGPPAPGLAALAHDASLLVLGHRGRGGFAGMLLGSVALRTVAHAGCPVAVARGERREMNRVLAGVDVDDPTAGRAQLGFAFDEAVMRAADLVVLHTWEDQGAFYPDPVGDYTRDHLTALDADHRERLEAMLEPWRHEYPDVAVDLLVEGGSAARHLVEASGHADLLVMGGLPRRDGEGMRLGGLTYSLLHHAQCPVAVVPERVVPER
jgi:nucleotide-binding universal stress UspA family protein